eukprot:SAG31_NODE_4922_length_2863_cov_1.316570_3_plen_467_part_00
MLAGLLPAVLTLLAAPASPSLHAVTSSADNDLVALLKSARGRAVISTAPSWRDAISAASPGDGLLLLADGYPAAQTAAPAELWVAAAAKRLKIFLEYPAQLPLTSSWVPPPPPPPPPPPGIAPCLPRPADLLPHKGFAAHFEYRNHDEALCAPRGNKVWIMINFIIHYHYYDIFSLYQVWINTSFTGQQCGDRDDVIWQHLVTKHPRPGIPAGDCSWNGSSTPEYSGKGCGIAPQWSNSKTDPGTQNVTQFMPMWFCPPAGYKRAPIGGIWTGGRGISGHNSVKECEAQCGASGACVGFSLEDADVSGSTGCTIYTSMKGDVTPRPKTTAYVKLHPGPPPPPPGPPPPPPSPPPPKPVTLSNWNALRPSTGAQPAFYRGVMQPRMSANVAAAWKRAGLSGLDIIEHYAAQITSPTGWATHSNAPYCHGSTQPTVDCTLEQSATVHAYSTIAAGFGKKLLSRFCAHY